MSQLKFISQPAAASSCCPPQNVKEQGFIDSHIDSTIGHVPRVRTTLTNAEIFDHLKCRVSAYRNSYTVEPGLYAVGNPTAQSEVMVSANYKLSFDHLRRALAGLDAWVLVLDTKGINVWCAAGKGTFSTAELISRIRSSRITELVSHNRLIVPQLGAVGISAHDVRQATGLRVHYGPVLARDIKQYIGSGLRATDEMRTVRFTILDRLILTPMEIRPAMGKFPHFAIPCLIIMGLKREGVLFSPLWHEGMPLVTMLLAAIISGALLTPLLLPYIPARAFSIKGYALGLASMLGLHLAGLMGNLHPLVIAASWLWFPVLSSYIALQFTGSTTFTGMSGVKRELKYGLPLYIAASVIAACLLIAYKILDLRGSLS